MSSSKGQKADEGLVEELAETGVAVRQRPELALGPALEDQRLLPGAQVFKHIKTAWDLGKELTIGTGGNESPSFCIRLKDLKNLGRVAIHLLPTK